MGPRATMAMHMGSVSPADSWLPMPALAFLVGFDLRGAPGALGCCGWWCILCVAPDSLAERARGGSDLG